MLVMHGLGIRYIKEQTYGKRSRPHITTWLENGEVGRKYTRWAARCQWFRPAARLVDGGGQHQVINPRHSLTTVARNSQNEKCIR